MDDDLNRLATLDPARGREPGAAEWARSRERLAEAMTAGPAKAPRRVRRLVIGLVAATLLAAGATVVVPAMLPNGDTAYASWTAVPENLPGREAERAAQACARSWDEGRYGAGEIVLAERRGVTVLLVMWLRDGPMITCSSLGTGRPAGAERLSDDKRREPPAPAAGRVNLDGGMGATGIGDMWYSQTVGRVGPGVTGVEIALPDGRKVRASVRQGWWAAWWPGHEAGEPDTIRIVVHAAGGTTTYRQDEVF